MCAQEPGDQRSMSEVFLSTALSFKLIMCPNMEVRGQKSLFSPFIAWVPEINSGCIPKGALPTELPYCIAITVLRDKGSQCIWSPQVWLNWLLAKSSRNLTASAPSTEDIGPSHPALNHQCWKSNSGPNVCVARALPTKPFSTPTPLISETNLTKPKLDNSIRSWAWPEIPHPPPSILQKLGLLECAIIPGLGCPFSGSVLKN